MKRLLKIVLILLLVLAALWTTLFRTRYGHARLERWVASALPSDIAIAGLGGALPFQGHLERIALHDAEGPWLEVHQLALSIHPGSLLRREVVLTQIHAGRVDVLRAPEQSDGTSASAASRRWTLWVQAALVEHVQVSPEILGEPVAGLFRGQFRMEQDEWNAVASILAKWRDETVHIVGSAYNTPTGSFLRITHAEMDGLSLAGEGAWSPEPRFAFHGGFTNTPLLRRLAGLDDAGTGSVSGRVEWGEARRVQAAVQVSGVAGYGASNVQARALGDWSPGEGWRARIEPAVGDWRGVPWWADAPIVVGGLDGAIEWKAPALVWNGAQAASTGRWSDGAIDIELSVPSFALSTGPLSNIFRAGTVRASIHASGTREEPFWRLDVEGDDVQPRLDSAFQLKPAAWRLTAEAANGIARIETRLSGWTEQPVSAEATLPIRLPLDGGPLGPDPDGPVSARLRFNLDLAAAGDFTDLRGTEIEGQLSCDLLVDGTWSEPSVRGQLALTDGRAAFPDSGTVLEDIQVFLEGDQRRLLIRRATANDGSRGRIELDGAIQFDPAHGFPLTGGLTLHRATLWRQDGNRLELDGRVAVEGPVRAPVVTGHVDLVNAEVRLRPIPPAIPKLPMAEEAPAAPTFTEYAGWLKNVALDVLVRARDIHVLGRGLDSTWRADLRVDGSAHAPRLRGPLSVDRGFFLFMGRRFTLERAVLTFDGKWPPAPVIDLVASARAGDMRARLYAAGPIDAPALNLESEPAYPVDEILARLLFGRSTDAISPFQAVRLAHGLNVLRGRGRTLDVLERGQSVLRVDQLDLVQSDQESGISAISVGKYVGRTIYVEGEKGLGESADLITVEVELTPSLILTTESSPRIREGIGLKWRRDY
ncbi:MAG TPA: translocation/assembly module TamB domain-containing protein [Kiritimatiellia bacterium]|nr:translocation/assembly module TamB domain-containing protein [Kiritimatiellia bacterium]